MSENAMKMISAYSSNQYSLNDNERKEKKRMTKLAK